MGVFSQLHPEFRPWAEWIYYVAEVNRLQPTLTSGYRSLSEQKRLYDRSIRGDHPYPVAPPGRSQHNYGLAIDMVSTNNDALGRYWNSLGLHWSPTDAVHFGV